MAFKFVSRPEHKRKLKKALVNASRAVNDTVDDEVMVRTRTVIKKKPKKRSRMSLF